MFQYQTHISIVYIFRDVFIIVYNFICWNKQRKQCDYSRKSNIFLINWRKINLQAGDIYNKDRQCTYNVTLRRVRVTIVAVEMQKYYILWVCVCILSYTARNAYALHYIVICVLSGCNIFFHIISQRTLFSENRDRTQEGFFYILYKLCLKHSSF